METQRYNKFLNNVSKIANKGVILYIKSLSKGQKAEKYG
jgi:hypothetical protein